MYSDLKEQMGQIRGEEKVFDTWMDSSNSNLFVSGYLNQPEVFEKAFPTALRPQGKEIVRTWLYYTLSSLRSCLSNQVSSMYGSMVWAWTRGAERCPNRSEMESMPIVYSNAVQEDERVHGRCEDRWFCQSQSKQNWQ